MFVVRCSLFVDGSVLWSGLVEVDQREYLASDGLVAGPEDEVRAPLHRLGDVGQGEEIHAKAFDIHG